MEQLEQCSDLELWKSVRIGDEKAFKYLYDSNILLCYNFGMKLIEDKDAVEDAIQEAFVELWQNRNKIVINKSFQAYLIGVVRNKLHAVMRAKFKKVKFHELELEAEPSIIGKIVESETQYELQAKIRQAIRDLPLRQREIIYLKFYCQYNNDEISLIMSISKGSVYNLVYHSLERLRKAVSMIAVVNLIQLPS